jgi:hypothetical protein
MGDKQKAWQKRRAAEPPRDNPSADALHGQFLWKLDLKTVDATWRDT